jgi:hypothetical protein
MARVERQFFPTQFSTRTIKNKSKESGKEQYKEEHLELFGYAKLQWPVDADTVGEVYTVSDMDALGTRGFEEMVFLNVMFRPRSRLEFTDVNHGLSRQLTWKLGASHEEFDKMLAQKEPWRPYMSTITSLSKIVCRYTYDVESGIVNEVRVVEGWEVMSATGWAPCMWTPTRQRVAADCQVSLAGNAFSAFAVGPATIAGLLKVGSMQFCDDTSAVPSTGGSAEDARDEQELEMSCANDSGGIYLHSYLPVFCRISKWTASYYF